VGKKLMLLKKKIERKKSENLKAEKKINLAQIRWFPVLRDHITIKLNHITTY